MLNVTAGYSSYDEFPKGNSSENVVNIRFAPIYVGGGVAVLFFLVGFIISVIIVKFPKSKCSISLDVFYYKCFISK